MFCIQRSRWDKLVDVFGKSALKYFFWYEINKHLYLSLLSRKKIYFRLRNGHNLCLRLYTRDFDFSESILVGNIVNHVGGREGEYDDVFIEHSDCYIDAGANIGLFSVLCKIKNPAAKIIALEPEKENFEMLKENTKGYDGIVCLNNGIWYRDAFCKVEASRCKANEHMMSDGAFWISECSKEDSGACRAYSLETIMNRIDSEDNIVLKMDVEGAEEKIFETNNLDWVKRCRLIVCETHEWLFEGNCMGSNIINILTQMNFEYHEKGENKYFSRK